MWVVLPSHAVVLFVHGGSWPGGVRLWAVVVVLVGPVLGVVLVVVVVVVVAEVLMAVVVVVGLVVVVVLWVCPQGPLAFRWGPGVRHGLQPLGLHGFVNRAGLGFGLTANAVEGSHVPGSGWPALVVVCGGWMVMRLEMPMWTRVLMGSCCVAASTVTACGAGWGAPDALGAGSWFGFGLGFGSGRGCFWCCCCRSFCGIWGCVGWCGRCW